MNRRAIPVFVLLLLAGLGLSCSIPVPRPITGEVETKQVVMRMPEPMHEGEYIEAEPKRIGTFPEDYVEKYVTFATNYQSLSQSHWEMFGYSPDSWVSVHTQASMWKPDTMLTILVPKTQSEELFELAPGSLVQVYGKLVSFQRDNEPLSNLSMNIAIEAQRVVVGVLKNASHEGSQAVPEDANEAMILFIEKASEGGGLDAESKSKFSEMLRGMKPANDEQKSRIDLLLEKFK